MDLRQDFFPFLPIIGQMFAIFMSFQSYSDFTWGKIIKGGKKWKKTFKTHFFQNTFKTWKPGFCTKSVTVFSTFVLRTPKIMMSPKNSNVIFFLFSPTLLSFQCTFQNKTLKTKFEEMHLMKTYKMPTRLFFGKYGNFFFISLL